MAYKRTSPQPIIEGGTGAQTFTTNGVVIGNGTSALSATAAGTTGQVLTGNTGSAPTFQSPAASSITITGDTGGGLTGNSFTLTGGTTGLTFSGAISTETLGGTLVVANGGTGQTALTAHDIIIGNGTSAVTLLAPSVTSGVPLVSKGSSADPAYDTAVVAGGGTGNTTFTAYSVICAGTTATGAFQNVSGLGSAGQILTSNGASALPTWQAAAGGFTWSVITADQSAVINNGYICNKGGNLVLTLPSTSAAGTTIRVTGINNATGWKIAQNSGQTIYFGSQATTTGTGGYLQSASTRDSVELVCVVADTSWNVISSVGNITYV